MFKTKKMNIFKVNWSIKTSNKALIRVSFVRNIIKICEKKFKSSFQRNTCQFQAHQPFSAKTHKEKCPNFKKISDCERGSILNLLVNSITCF